MIYLLIFWTMILRLLYANHIYRVSSIWYFYFQRLLLLYSYVCNKLISKLYVYYILIFIHLIFYIYHSDFLSLFFSTNDTYKTFLVQNRWKNGFLFFLAYLANFLVRQKYERLLYHAKVIITLEYLLSYSYKKINAYITSHKLSTYLNIKCTIYSNQRISQ